MGRARRALRAAPLVWQAFGARGLIRRASYLAQLRSGIVRRRLAAERDFSDAPAQRWDFAFDIESIRANYSETAVAAAVTDEVVRDADRLLGGEYRMFGGAWTKTGWPFDWLTSPTSGATYPATHWTNVSDDDPERGDIKDVWELSRFRPTFLLARAFVVTGDDRYPEAWWKSVESWAAANPPNIGPNWRCAQETSLRAIAWSFGLSAFGCHQSTTPERRALLERLLGASVRRVNATLSYALSQRNNHAISELVFLLSVPGPKRHRLVRLLREALSDQFLRDGSYGQQSLVYQRLAIHTLVWLHNVQPQLDPRLRRAILERLDASAAFILHHSDPVSGLMPNYGPNDGTNLLDLATAEHLDIRPTLSLLGTGTGDVRAAETSIWLRAKVLAGSQDAPPAPSTYSSLRGPRSLLFTRVGSIDRRAADADQQAIELFINGRRLVIDPGTYRYSGRGPWRNPFVGLEAHSAPRTRERHGSRAVGRFLRSPIKPAELVEADAQTTTDLMVTRRRDHSVTTVRAIVRDGDRYAVVDHISGGDGTVRWNLSGGLTLDVSERALVARDDWATVDVDANGRLTVHQRDEALPGSGWWSPTYGEKAACHAVEISMLTGSTTFTLITPSGEEPLDRAVVERLVRPHIRRALQDQGSP